MNINDSELAALLGVAQGENMKPGKLQGRAFEIREMRKQGHTLESIAAHIGCSFSSIAAVCSGEAYAKADRSDDKRERRCSDCGKTYTRYHSSGVPWVEYYRCAACAAIKWYSEQMAFYGRVLH